MLSFQIVFSTKNRGNNNLNNKSYLQIKKTNTKSNKQKAGQSDQV